MTSPLEPYPFRSCHNCDWYNRCQRKSNGMLNPASTNCQFPREDGHSAWKLAKVTRRRAGRGGA